MTTREMIEAAFADVPYPGDDHLADEDSLDCDDVRTLFRGKSWRGLSMKELRGEWSALTFCSAEALQYFIPAYMIATLGHWREADLIPDWILYKWLPPDEDETELRRQYRVKRQSIFTPAQKAAIAAYLREYAADEDSNCNKDQALLAIETLLNEEPIT